MERDVPLNTARIKNWSIGTNQNDFTAPALLKCRLQGQIYDDSRGTFQDGDYVTTSSIEKVIDCGTHKTFLTANTKYIVAPSDINPEYEKAYPGAYDAIYGTGE